MPGSCWCQLFYKLFHCVTLASLRASLPTEQAKAIDRLEEILNSDFGKKVRAGSVGGLRTALYFVFSSV